MALAREEEIGPDGGRPERGGYGDAVQRLLQSELPALLEENRHLHKLISGELRVDDSATAKDFLVVQAAGKHPMQRCQ